MAEDAAIFRCPVCLNLLQDPVSIPCGHSYCMSCITECWGQDDQKGVYTCPQCRQTFSPRPALNKNTVLTTVVEKMKKAKLQAAECYAGAGDVECDVCTGRKAVKSSLVCLNSFCQNHIEQHENPFKGQRHNLMDATERFQEMICPKHNKQLEIYCCTDQKWICYLCTMDNHKNHDTVAAVAERTEKQVILEERRRKSQQKLQRREKDVQELKEAIKSHKRSAQTAVEDSERIFTELISSIERSRSEVTQLIRDQQKSAVSSAERLLERLKQEIDDLKGEDAELKQLLHTDDHIHFLQSFQCLSIAHESTASPSITVSSFNSFDDVGKTVAQLKKKLQDFCKEVIKEISKRDFNIFLSREETVSEEEEEDTKPFVLMPEVKTSEEDEEVLFKERTKLYCWDRDLSQWKERGVGSIKILFHTAKYGVVMRKDQVLKLCANHTITKNIELKFMNASPNAVMWTATDYAEGVAKVEQFAAKFRTLELAEAFKRTFSDCQSCLSQMSITEGLSRETNPVVYFSIAVDDEPIGQITMELFSHIVPKTSENFRALCTGEKGFGYRNSVFHRIIPDFMCQGGDITNEDGTGGKSIYGNKFEDENFDVRHTGPGLLSMANHGRDTNSSQFFITLKKAEHLDFKQVAFGFVKDGMDVLKEIGKLGTKTGKPTKKVVIIDCGEL